ncbi:Uncharacterized protein C18B11.06 [Golovinomyces cichoracearum]|uniref:Uncharacterized protein C18B11.06 n=1 Tax=Golovinomyces cichoracearum TaxID=62708 RepID=A0A420ITD8_9PEZI|nr:Uncharacterized protein C18B11.06 [Golovinomyces cichoracearum]
MLSITSQKATDISYISTIENLSKALSSASECLENLKTPLFVDGGITLFDVKNEIFFSYLHNLVFLIVLKLRSRRNEEDESNKDLDDSVVKKLIELQVYIDKGVRPLENRLKYQIEKVLQASEDAKASPLNKSINSKEQDDKDPSADDTDDESDVDSTERIDVNVPDIKELQHRPNPGAFIRPAIRDPTEDLKEINDTNIYKPPKIHAVSMPTTRSKEDRDKRPGKLAAVDEFINTEMSTAPITEPSIGSNIVNGGRRNLTEKERNEEKERREYEERNYVRLPTLSKKERAKKRGSRRDPGYGGEEWRGLGEGIDRIEKLTSKKNGDRNSFLDKSRKRPNEDESRENGIMVGQGFQKKLKRLDKRKRVQKR